MIHTTIDEIVKSMKETNWTWAPIGNKSPNKEEFIDNLASLISELNRCKDSNMMSTGGIKVTKEGCAKGVAYFNDICEFKIPESIAPDAGISAKGYARTVVNTISFRNEQLKQTVRKLVERAFVMGTKWQRQYGTD